MSNKHTATSFLTFTASGKVKEAFDDFVSKDFLHHNPYFPGDAESFCRAMEESFSHNRNREFMIKQVIEEGSFVVTHSHVKQTQNDDGFAVVHIFRFEGAQIAELWDIGQPIPKRSSNTNGMF